MFYSVLTTFTNFDTVAVYTCWIKSSQCKKFWDKSVSDQTWFVGLHHFACLPEYLEELVISQWQEEEQ